MEADHSNVAFLKIDLELMTGRVEIGDMKMIIDLTPGFLTALRRHMDSTHAKSK